jgi:WD40 repeat protein
MRKIKILFLLVGFSLNIQAQVDTDIFVYDLNLGKGKISNSQNLTHWKGYDNQPSFSPDGQRLYFTRIMGQAEVYYYDLKMKFIREFTRTEESEYSPTATPDGKYISVIQVEKDSTQRLWKFPIPKGPPELVFENVKPVGYHVWIDNENVAMFILGKSNSLQVGNTVTGDVKTITYDIGRSLHTYNGSVYFVSKESSMIWWIKKMDAATGEVSRIEQTLKEREDFTVTSSGRILMGDGKIIYELKSGQWKKLITVESNEFTDFNRIVVSPDEKKLVIVAVMK